jgi:deoxyribose-phosphate aldolase
MPNLQASDPAERFDIAYLFANGGSKDLKDSAKTAREIGAYGMVVHGNDLKIVVPLLKGSLVKPSIVVSFPDGRVGWRAKYNEAVQAGEDEAIGLDPVVNLFPVLERDKNGILHDCLLLRQGFFEGSGGKRYPEIKLISQIPYLWTLPNGKDLIRWLIDLLPEAGVFCIKDWTTRQNFSPDVKLATSANDRISYTAFMKDYIEKRKLNLFIKIAGSLTPEIAPAIVEAGADILGISAHRAAGIREALLRK